MKQFYFSMKLSLVFIFMLPGLLQAQAIKDSIRKNYTKEKYEAYLLKVERGEIPDASGPVKSVRAGAGDILVNNNVGATTEGLFTQSETAILVFGNTIVVGFNDGGSYTGEANKFTGWSYSTDGGLTFTDGGTLPNDPIGDLGDPVLARNETTGRIYYATLGFDDPETIQVFISDDDALSWNAPVVGTPGGDNEDKQWMAVDNFPGAGNGNVYLISRRFGGYDPGIYLFTSTDDGATFGPDGGVEIVPAGVNNNQQGSFVAVGPDHTVYAFWMNDPENSIQLRKSTDFGATFGDRITIVTGLAGEETNNGLLLTSKRNGDDDFQSAGRPRSNSFPHAAVNPASGHLYLVYNDNPPDEDKANVYMVMSSDAGETWTAPVQVNDDATTTDQWQPTITVTPDGSQLGVFYTSREDDTENNLFTYNGRIGIISGTTVTFSPSFVISDVLSLPEFGRDSVMNLRYMGDYNMACATNTHFHVVWSDNREELPDGDFRMDPNVYYESIEVLQPPVAECQPVVKQTDEYCQTEVTPAEVDNGSYSPDGWDITLSLSPPGPYPLGITDVTLTVLDSQGLSSTCETTITIVDQTPPVPPAPPADVFAECAGDVPPVIDLTTMDNCDGEITVSPTLNTTPGDCVNDFVQVRTWTFADASGNTTSVNQVITVNDKTAPVPPAPPADVLVQCAGDVPPPVDLTATDNCDGAITVSPTLNTTPGDCVNDFVQVRTWTFVDACGNSSSVSQVITVNDNTAPVPPAPPADLLVQCASDVPPTVNLTAIDNCDGPITVSPTINITPGTSVNDFVEVRTWTFTDVCGNTSSVSQTITVYDDTPPELIVTTDPIKLWPPNHAYKTILLSDLFVSVSDNCSDLTIDDVDISSASSDEVENAEDDGDGDTWNDMVIDSDCQSVDLRAERSGEGNGRVYWVYLTVSDENGNSTTAGCQVYVPHEVKTPAIDDGVVWAVDCNKTRLVSSETEEVLLMNYPNPFDGSTKVSFRINETNRTTLKVYDLYGNEIATLFEGNAEAGQKYDLDFSPANRAKGIYLYHLQSGSQVSVVKKMILIR